MGQAPCEAFCRQSLAEDLSEDRRSVWVSRCYLLHMLAGGHDFPCFTNEKTEWKKLFSQLILLEPGLQSRLESKIHTLNQCFCGSFFPSLIPCGLSSQLPGTVPAFSRSGASGDPPATLCTLHSERQTQWSVFMNIKLTRMKLPIVSLSGLIKMGISRGSLQYQGPDESWVTLPPWFCSSVSRTSRQSHRLPARRFRLKEGEGERAPCKCFSSRAPDPAPQREGASSSSPLGSDSR